MQMDSRTIPETRDTVYTITVGADDRMAHFTKAERKKLDSLNSNKMSEVIYGLAIIASASERDSGVTVTRSGRIRFRKSAPVKFTRKLKFR